jgi:hypothetical protein
MKFARISMAVVMLMALVLRSLPDSVFDYFHSHTHVSCSDCKSSSTQTIEDYQHNCHIEDWNFESFEVSETQITTIQQAQIQPNLTLYHAVLLAKPVSKAGRGPPAA